MTNRSACHIKLEKFELALQDATTAIQIDGSYWKGYARAINVSLILGDIGQAEKFMEQFIQAIPGIESLKFNEKAQLETLKAHQTKIVELFSQENFFDCRKTLNKAMKIATHCDRYESLSVECLIMMEQFAEAERAISDALKKNPENFNAIFNQALLEYFTGR